MAFMVCLATFGHYLIIGFQVDVNDSAPMALAIIDKLPSSENFVFFE
jgi:hypothetical protein